MVGIGDGGQKLRFRLLCENKKLGYRKHIARQLRGQYIYGNSVTLKSIGYINIARQCALLTRDKNDRTN